MILARITILHKTSQYVVLIWEVSEILPPSVAGVFDIYDVSETLTFFQEFPSTLTSEG